MKMGWSRRSLRLVLAVELLWGAGLTCVELLWQPRTAELLGSSDDTFVFGLTAASGWVAGAVGAALLPLLIRLLAGGTTRAAAAMRVLQGVTVLGLGLAGGVLGVATAYVAFYAVHGAANPAHFALLHRQVGASERATVLSVNSRRVVSAVWHEQDSSWGPRSATCSFGHDLVGQHWSRTVSSRRCSEVGSHGRPPCSWWRATPATTSTTPAASGAVGIWARTATPMTVAVAGSSDTISA